jgi:valyl-tRNA synthetase
MASPGRDVKLSKDRIIGNRNFITKIWSANNFLKLNKCILIKNINLDKIKLPINQWIFSEFIETQEKVTENIEQFRFDEAARHAYKFVWHYYCDWYLEFLKPIFNSKNKNEIKEAKNFSSFMLARILEMLHPFIPFFTETVWRKNRFNNFNKNQVNINNLIELISSIRSTKAELNITPKLYCDIIFFEKSKKLKLLIDQNINLIKQIGRVKSLINKKKLNKNIIEIIVLKEKLGLKFNENVDMISQKNKILEKIENIKKQMNKLSVKLQNKAYLKNAPKEIVKNDKVILKDLIIEDNKLRSIVSSIN